LLVTRCSFSYFVKPFDKLKTGVKRISILNGPMFGSFDFTQDSYGGRGAQHDKRLSGAKLKVLDVKAAGH